MIGHVTNELRHHKFREDRMQCTTWPAKAVVYGPSHVADEGDQFTCTRYLGNGQRVCQQKEDGLKYMYC